MERLRLALKKMAVLGVTLDLFDPLSAAASTLTRCVSVTLLQKLQVEPRSSVGQQIRPGDRGNVCLAEQGYDLTIEGDVNKENLGLGFSVRSATTLSALLIRLELITLSDNMRNSRPYSSLIASRHSSRLVFTSYLPFFKKSK